MRTQCDRCDAVTENQETLLERIKELEAEVEQCHKDIVKVEAREQRLSHRMVTALNRGKLVDVELRKALANVVAACEEHIECEPGMYANECIGLGGADGLMAALSALDAALRECEL